MHTSKYHISHLRFLVTSRFLPRPSPACPPPSGCSDIGAFLRPPPTPHPAMIGDPLSLYLSLSFSTLSPPLPTPLLFLYFFYSQKKSSMWPVVPIIMKQRNGRIPSHKPSNKFSLTRFGSKFNFRKSIFALL